MKILFVTSYFPPIAGGSAVVYYNLCKWLSNEVSVLTTWRHYIGGKEIENWKEFDAKQQFPIKRVELLRPQILEKHPRHFFESAMRVLLIDLPLRLKILRIVLKTIKTEHIDVICIGELYALAWLARTLKFLKKTPCIFYIHGEEITTGSMSRFYGRNAVKTLRKADGVITISHFTYDEVIKRDVNNKRVHIIPNGVDFKRFRNGVCTKEIVKRHQLSGKKVLLTVGRVEKRKGHDLVIKSLSAIRQKVPNTVYLIVGIGSDIERLKQLSQRHGVAESVMFAGLVPEDELTSYYHACDVFVMPNRTLENGDTEGFGLVFLEANACGKPVIGGNAGGVPDAVIHEKTGLLIDGHSEQEFTQAAVKLLTDVKFAQNISRHGRKRARALDWEAKASEFRKICQQILE